MPTFEHSQMHPRTSENAGLSSYSKILALYNSPTGPSGNTPNARLNRISIAFKDSSAYEKSLIGFDQDTYSRSAGADLASLFIPYETYINNVSGLPGFYSGINSTYGFVRNYPSGNSPTFMDYLPVDWEPTTSGYVYDMWNSPSGDSINNIISGSGYWGSTGRYRDKFDMRGIALRAPMMITGWGFDLETRLPFPSGHQRSDDSTVYPSGTSFWKGGHLVGYSLPQDDYVTAPLELYYDQKKNVWTTPGLPTGQGLYRVLMLIDEKNPGTYGLDVPRFST